MRGLVRSLERRFAACVGVTDCLQEQGVGALVVEQITPEPDHLGSLEQTLEADARDGVLAE